MREIRLDVLVVIARKHTRSDASIKIMPGQVCARKGSLFSLSLAFASVYGCLGGGEARGQMFLPSERRS